MTFPPFAGSCPPLPRLVLKTVRAAAFVFAALLLSLLSPALSATDSPRPNIIFILADDLGMGDLGSYGGEVPTPNLDRMAAEGVRFTQAYSGAPICSPSRAALITGQMPARWRITSYLQTRKGNRACEQDDFLDPKAPSLPRALKTAGYKTAHVGKWHLGGGRDVTNAPPFSAYGYDAAWGTYESPEPHPEITATNWIWSRHDQVKRWDRTRWMVDRTLDFLRQNQSNPVFVNLWLDDPHTPWIPNQEVMENRGRQGDAKPNLRPVLVEMDRQLGRLLEGVRALKDRETLVIFMSDNGPLPTFNQTRAAGYRGAKLSLYEAGIRVPLIAWWPGKVPAGAVQTNTIVSALDFFPTFQHLAGAAPKGSPVFDGQNIAPALVGKEVQRTGPLFWEYGRNTNSFAYPPPRKNRSPNVAMRDGDWKLLVTADGHEAELYNLKDDPFETTDLSSEKPDLTEKMKERALAWRRSLPGSPGQ